MKVKELIKKLKEYDREEEIRLRIRYVKGKEDAFFDFRVREYTPWALGYEEENKEEKIIVIESKVDIDDFLTEEHGCIEYRNY